MRPAEKKDTLGKVCAVYLLQILPSMKHTCKVKSCGACAVGRGRW